MASGGSSVLDEYEWETLPDMQVARCYSVAAYHEGKLYVFGEQLKIILWYREFQIGSRVCGEM